MKNLRLIARAGMLSLGVLLACSSDDLNISVSDSDDAYEFAARFDRHRTQRVQKFINAHMAPGTVVTGNYVDITAILDDDTRFVLEESPGEVRIKLDKEVNSAASYHRVKRMCEGLKKVILEK